MKRLLAILTALLLCFPFLPIGGPQALADGSGCFLSGSFPSVYNEVLKRDFLTVLTQDPSAGDLQFFPYQMMFRSQSGSSELFATSDGLVRLSFEYGSPDEVGVSGRPASSVVLSVPSDYDSLKQNAYMLSLIHALSQLDPGFNESTATMLMLTAGPSPVTLDVSMGQLTAQLQDGEYTFTLTRSGASSPSAPEVPEAGSAADLPEAASPAQNDVFQPAVTDPPAAPAPQAGAAPKSGDLILDMAGVQVYYTGISHVVFDQEVDLKIQYVIINNSGRKIVLNIGDASVNGVSANTVGISIMDPGASENDQLYIEPVDSASQQAICSPSRVSVDMTLKDGTNYQELGSYTLAMDVNSLPAVTPRPEAKFPVSSLPAETPAPVPSSGGFSVLTPGSVIMSASGVEMIFREISYVVFDDEVDLKVKYSITNRSGRDIVLNTGDTLVNGIHANTVGISIIKNGESSEDQMYIEPVDSASQQAICNPVSLSVALTLQDGGSYKQMAAGALNMAVSLPSTTPKPNPKFPFDVSSSSAGDSRQGSSGTVRPGDTIMSLSGVEVRYTGVQHVVFDDEVDLKVLYSIINNSGRNIVLNIDGARVNGVAAGTVGISILKPGESDNDQIYIEPQDAASLQAICSPYSLSVDLRLKDGDSYAELGTTTFSLSDISLPAVTPKPGSKFSSDSVPTPVPNSSASSGSRVLVFPDNANGQWQNVGTDQLKFRCQVQNVSGSDSIRAFELYLYPTDVWGNRLLGSDEVYYHTTNRQIHPGQTAYSDYFTIGDRAKTANVYVGIKRVILTDGTVYDYDDVEYWSWTIK